MGKSLLPISWGKTFWHCQLPSNRNHPAEDVGRCSGNGPYSNHGDSRFLLERKGTKFKFARIVSTLSGLAFWGPIKTQLQLVASPGSLLPRPFENLSWIVRAFHWVQAVLVFLDFSGQGFLLYFCIHPWSGPHNIWGQCRLGCVTPMTWTVRLGKIPTARWKRRWNRWSSFPMRFLGLWLELEDLIW